MDHDNENFGQKTLLDVIILPGNVLGDSFRRALTVLNGDLL
jgi:hypothetical protein